MSCQKKIAATIVEQGGDYLLQVKGNQGGLHDETVTLFDQCLTDDCHGIAYRTAKTLDKGHGRIEQRQIWATSEVNWFAERGKWKNLRSLLRVRAQRTVGQQTSTEDRYYITDLPADNPAGLLAYIRQHWGVENNLLRLRDTGHFAEWFERLRERDEVPFPLGAQLHADTAALDACIADVFEDMFASLGMLNSTSFCATKVSSADGVCRARKPPETRYR